MTITHFYTCDADEATAAETNMGADSEGKPFYVFSQGSASEVPMYRAYNPSKGTHLYTTYIDERDVALNENGYAGEGINFWCLPPTIANPPSNATPLYRLYDPTTDDYIYSTNAHEPGDGHRAQGIAGFVYIADPAQHIFPPPTAVQLWRLRTPGGQHFCTANQTEYDNLLGPNVGYNADGTAGWVLPSSPGGPQPFYRSYHPTTGGHLYTVDITESDAAATGGYRGDGISGYIWPNGKELSHTSELYRGYNPTLDDHLYTLDPSEIADAADYHGEYDAGWVLSPDVGPYSGIPMYRFLGDFTRDFILPPATLVGNSNFLMTSFIGNRWNAVMGLTVDIEIQADLVLNSISGGLPTTVPGFSFQLNGQSPKTFNSGWQQYTMSVLNGEIGCEIQNYAADNDYSIGFIVGSANLHSLGKNTLPAGYRFQIALLNDSYGNVLGAEFSVYKGTTKHGSAKLLVKDLPDGATFGSAPILGFQMVLVGPEDGATANFAQGGAGLITYRAASPLYAQPWEPVGFGDVATINWPTGEQSNSYYGQIAATKSKTLNQAFGVQGPAPEK
jgi:hypothetical protein